MNTTLNKTNKLIYRDTREEKRKAEEDLRRKLSDPIPIISNENLLKSIQEQSSYAEPKQDLEVSKRVDKFRLSFIEDYEEEEAKKQIEELLGFETPRVCGYHMVVKIYVRPEEIATFTNDKGETVSLYAPHQVTAHDKFRNCTALVIAQGSDCYQGTRFQEHWFIRFARIFFNRWMPPKKKFPWCKVGDWIVFPRNEGPQINYRGIPVQIIPDDKCYLVIQDPTHVTRD